MRADAAVVVAGGDGTGQVLPPRVAGWPVVAADGGLDLAEGLGLAVDAVVGDLDSVSPGALARAQRRGAAVHRAPTDKDLTDLELAISHTRRHLPDLRELVVLGGAAGRLDHLLANLAVLTGPITEGLRVEAWLGPDLLVVVRSEVRVPVGAGSTVSLLAWHGPATGVTTAGLRWALRDAVLEPGSALGTSNLAVDDHVGVSIASGVVGLLVPASSTTNVTTRPEERPA